MLHASGFDPGLTARWRDAVDDHKAHAAEEFPREACGLILRNGRYRRCQNIAADPYRDFEIPAIDMFDVHGHSLAVLHSHCSSRDPVDGQIIPPLESPSAQDMLSQMAMGVPWGITMCVEDGATDPIWFGDEVPRAPLYGRRFIHGVYDCYAFIRDWHREVAKIEIPDFPRDANWYERDRDGSPPQQNLYMDGFGQAGFARVTRGDEGPRPGDVFLCSVLSPVMNHGGVYLGGGLIGHHLLHQTSTRQPAEPWRQKLSFLVRHTKLPEDWQP